MEAHTPRPDEIRALILDDIRREGRRLDVAEARRRYGHYGPEALEAIASLADSGILIRNPRAADGMPGGDRGFGGDRGLGGDRGGQASAGGGDIAKGIEQAVHGIVAEIERSFGGHFTQEHAASIDRFVDAGSRGIASAASALRKAFAGSPPARNEAERYRASLETKHARLRKGLWGNLSSFIVVNAGLVALNIFVATGFPWSAIVALSWAIGVVGNIVDLRRVGRQAAEARALPDLDANALAEYKRINRQRDSLSGHLVSAFTVPPLLFAINMFTSPATPWFLIPSAILAGTAFLHAIGHAVSMPPRLGRFYASQGIEGGRRELFASGEARRRTAEELGDYAGLYREAETAIRDIGAEMRRHQDRRDAAETSLDLTRYLDQVRTLASTAHELDRILASIPLDSLRRDAASLKERLPGASDTLRKEYQASIDEIDRQLKAHRELQDQKELIGLRLTSSVHQLSRMKLDLAKVHAAGAGSGGADAAGAGAAGQAGAGAGGADAIERIRRRSEELSRYLDDLKAGRLEAQADPFAELERLDREGKLPDAPKSPPVVDSGAPIG